MQQDVIYIAYHWRSQFQSDAVSMRPLVSASSGLLSPWWHSKSLLGLNSALFVLSSRPICVQYGVWILLLFLICLASLVASVLPLFCAFILLFYVQVFLVMRRESQGRTQAQALSPCCSRWHLRLVKSPDWYACGQLCCGSSIKLAETQFLVLKVGFDYPLWFSGWQGIEKGVQIVYLYLEVVSHWLGGQNTKCSSVTLNWLLPSLLGSSKPKFSSPGKDDYFLYVLVYTLVKEDTHSWYKNEAKMH